MPRFSPRTTKGKYAYANALKRNYGNTFGRIDGSSLGQRSRFLARYRKGRRSVAARSTDIGFPVSFGTSKANHVQTSVNADLASRTLHVGEITAIPKQTSLLEIDRRERNIVNALGWKIQWELSHTIAAIQPIVFNWALIAPKGKQGTPDATDFFRNHGGSRGIDFGIALSSGTFNNNKINDDLYDIITHRKVTLGPSNVSASLTYPPYKCQTTIDTWVPLNRQLRYDTQEGCMSPVYIVYWCDIMTNNGGQPIITNALRSQKSVAIHFKESL